MVVALDYLEPGEETNPKLLEQLRRASVTLDEAETKSLALKLTEP
jgi:hypothetical protein